MGKTILELGATGLVSIVCNHLGASRIVATDRESVIHALQSNIQLNLGDISEKSVDIQVLDWTECNLFKPNFSPNLIVGADLVYVEDLFPSLIKTLQLFTDENAVIYFCSKMRYERDFRFYELLKKEGFVVDLLVSVSERLVNVYQIKLKSS